MSTENTSPNFERIADIDSVSTTATSSATPGSKHRSPKQWLKGRFNVPPVTLAVALITLIAFALRLWQLGDRAFHHDESLDAWWSYRVLEGTYTGYDPVYHGPLRFYITAFFYMIMGETNFAARLFSALSGSIVVALPWLLRKWLKPVGTIFASAALCMSPTMLYYSRFGREDAQMVLLAMLVFVLGVSYLEKPTTAKATGIGFVFACSFAIKESTYLFALLLVLWVLMMVAAQFDARYHHELGLLDRSQKLRPAFVSALLLVASVGLTITVSIGNLGDELFSILTLYGLCLVVLIGAVVLRDIRLGRFKAPPILTAFSSIGWLGWAIAFGVFALSWWLFFTVWGKFPDQWLSGFTEAIGYWDSQQEVNRGGQPWYYYLYALPLYEWLFVFLAAIGTVVSLRRPTTTNTLFIWFSLGSIIIYSYAGERMPWLIAHPLLPMLILAGCGAQTIWEHREKAISGVLILAVSFGFALTSYDSLRASFPNGADSRELLSQAGQATSHINVVLERYRNLKEIQELRGEKLVMAVPTSNAWPYTWYLLKDEIIWYNPAGEDLPLHADVIIVDTPFDPTTVTTHQGTMFAFRSWWIPSYRDASALDLVKYVLDRSLWDRDPAHSHIGISEPAGEIKTGLAATLEGIDTGARESSHWWTNTMMGHRRVPGIKSPGTDGCGSVDQWLLVRNDLAEIERDAYPEAVYGLEPLKCINPR